MSTRNADGTPREVPYHRGCTFDGGGPHQHLCANPAVYHVVYIEDGEFIPYLTCHEHATLIMPGAADFHPVGDCCGEPGAKWQFRYFQGDSFCFQDTDEQQLHEELAAINVVEMEEA